MSSYIDLILIIFVIYSVYQGYQTGFLSSLGRLLFLVLGVLTSLFIAVKIKGILYPGLIASPYIAIGILALIFAALFRKGIKKLMIFLKSFLGKTDLMWLDPILGAFLGLVKTYLLVFIIISVIGSFNNKTVMKPILNSKIAFHMYSQVKQVLGFNLMRYLHNLSIPEATQQITKTLEKTADKIKQ